MPTGETSMRPAVVASGLESDHFLNAYQVGTKADVQKMESQAKAEAQRLWTEAEMKRTRSA